MARKIAETARNIHVNISCTIYHPEEVTFALRRVRPKVACARTLYIV